MLGGGAKCPRCTKTVYFAERATGPGGDWHKSCLCCKDCNKRLDSTTLAEHKGEAYCKACHGKNFGPKGYGFAVGGAGLMRADAPAGADVVNSSSKSSAPAGHQPQVCVRPNKPAASPSSGAKFCANCGNARAGAGKFCSNCGNAF